MHTVKIKRFAIGQFEVTFEEYDRFAIASGRLLPDDHGWGRGLRPVINVSWNEAVAYGDWLSQKTGNRYRLPTESEWEYAALSAGIDNAWSTDESELISYAVYEDNSQERTESVGERQGRKPNAIGLYDMSGNVSEWVQDCEHLSYKGAPTDGTAWLEEGGWKVQPEGPQRRLVRYRTERFACLRALCHRG